MTEEDLGTDLTLLKVLCTTRLKDVSTCSIKEAFALFDVDHNGEISMEELAQIMARHHVHPSRYLELSLKTEQILVASAKQSQLYSPGKS